MDRETGGQLGGKWSRVKSTLFVFRDREEERERDGRTGWREEGKEGEGGRREGEI